MGIKAVNCLLMVGVVMILGTSCTKETQNQIARSILNWTGTNGVLDVISNGKVMYRFINIDKLTTGQSADGARAYRYGYGVLDLNMNFVKDENEKRIYFEISDYSTSYVFYENPY